MLRSEGVDITTPRAAAPAFVAPVVGLGAELPVSARFEVAARAEASLPLSDHRFEIRGVGRVWELPDLAGRVGLGVGVLF